LTRLTTYFPHNGTSDATFHLFTTATATHVGEPSDPDEADRVEWLSWVDVLGEARAGRIGDGLSLTALLWQRLLGAPG
jgi:hypothetical protein